MVLIIKLVQDYYLNFNMAKKKPESNKFLLDIVEDLKTELVRTIDTEILSNFPYILYNQTKKYHFELEEKYGQIYFSVIKKNTSDHHIGTFKFDNIEELKSSPDILRYIQLENKNTFFNNFKYK